MKIYKIFIVILNWNRPGDTLECLQSLKQLFMKNFMVTVVLVDNGSGDDSVTRFKKFQPGDLAMKIIENKKNAGFAAGNNLGINYSLSQEADFVLFLNNDTIVDKNFISEIILTSEEKEEVGIFTPKIYFAKGFEFHKTYKKSELGRVIWSFGGNIDWQNMYAQNKHVDDVDSGQLNKNFETDFATGAAMFVKADVLKMHGGFDENYYLYM